MDPHIVPEEIWELILSYVFPSTSIKLVCKRWLRLHRDLVRWSSVKIEHENYRHIAHPHLTSLKVRGNIHAGRWDGLRSVTTLRTLKIVGSATVIVPRGDGPGCHLYRFIDEHTGVPPVRLTVEERDRMQRRIVAWVVLNPHLVSLDCQVSLSISMASLTQLQRMWVCIDTIEQIRALTQLQRLTLHVSMEHPQCLDLQPFTNLTRLHVWNTPYDPLLLPSSVVHLRVDTPLITTTVRASAFELRHVRHLDTRAISSLVQFLVLLDRLEELTLRDLDAPIDFTSLPLKRLTVHCRGLANVKAHPSTESIVFGIDGRRL